MAKSFKTTEYHSFIEYSTPLWSCLGLKHQWFLNISMFKNNEIFLYSVHTSCAIQFMWEAGILFRIPPNKNPMEYYARLSVCLSV